jgi:hypothetical protein
MKVNLLSYKSPNIYEYSSKYINHLSPYKNTLLEKSFKNFSGPSSIGLAL